MTGLWLLLGGVALIIGFALWHSKRRKDRRTALRALRLSDEDRETVRRVFALWAEIPEEIRMKTEGWMHVFLDEKSFEACGELEAVTREMKLAVAAQACLLIAHRPQDYYERLKSVLLYPGAYRALDGDGDSDVRLGESWGTGSVVLGWKSILQGGRNDEDGHNVVLHEFAHQLDQEDGAADGVPELDDGDDYGRWSQAFTPSYDAFCERVNAGKRSVLDDYGATNPAEFFAVATETFFEKAKAMKRQEPEVYGMLVEFYGMDPSQW
ncbi:zinc-dependent peptidase [Haloferula chungangensis]|uniref:Zinc-dependent peptidase n=1 Tax=Haloferula chungangensis TaxID=1048331 RepID=A0ABW2L322_9BACT